MHTRKIRNKEWNEDKGVCRGDINFILFYFLFIYFFFLKKELNTNKSSRAGWRNLAILISQTMKKEHKIKLRPRVIGDLNNNDEIETTRKNKQAICKKGGWSF